MDRLTPEQRSRIMARVGYRNTAPELAVRAILRAVGFRYRLHAKDAPGRPDIVNRKRRIAIFVHGCFWHSHNCPRAKLPTTNEAFWATKITRTKARDKKTLQALRG